MGCAEKTPLSQSALIAAIVALTGVTVAERTSGAGLATSASVDHPVSIVAGQDEIVLGLEAIPATLARVPVIRATLDADASRGMCPEERLNNYLPPIPPANYVSCPCFEFLEELAAVFHPPAGHYPIELLRVGIGWGSPGGGQPDTLEEAIKIYNGMPPNPGAPVILLEGPQMVDGGFNEFNLAAFVPQAERIIDSGPVMLSLVIFNDSIPGAAAPLHDGQYLGNPGACQFGKSFVFIFPPAGFWIDSCAAGVSGQWAMYVVYRPTDCDEPAECPGDVTGNGQVNSADLAELLGAWGPGGGPADTNDDGVVNSIDLATVLGSWGPCPV